MFTYITVGINDLPGAIRFYDAVLATLGIERRETDENEAGYATADDSRCRFWINHPFDRRAATVGNGSMPAWRQLSDTELAAVITYTKNAWSNQTGRMLQPAEMAAARTK